MRLLTLLSPTGREHSGRDLAERLAVSPGPSAATWRASASWPNGFASAPGPPAATWHASATWAIGSRQPGAEQAATTWSPTRALARLRAGAALLPWHRMAAPTRTRRPDAVELGRRWSEPRLVPVRECPHNLFFA